MMRWIGYRTLGVALVSLAAFGFQGGASPEKALNDFAAAFVAGDFKTAATYVVGGQVDPQLAMMAESIKSEGLTLKLFKMSTKITGDQASVSLTAEMGDKTGHKQTETETVPMKRSNGKWQIVPPASGNSEAMRKPIQGMALMLCRGMRPMFEDAKNRAKSTVALSNIKQLALATIMYASDYDDKFPPSVAGWHKAIFPYCKNEAIFKAPEAPSTGDSFALNPFVAGKNSAKLKMPADTVMLYEGKDQKLSFAHQGRAAIAFCDGHCKLVDAEAAKKLRWKP